MSGSWSEASGGAGAQELTRACIAADLLLLADLHDHEAHRDAVVALWARCYDGLLQAKPYGPALRDAVNRFCASLTEIPSCFDASTDEALGEDFRRIYAAAAGGRGPRESAWCETQVDHLRIDAVALRQWAGQRGIAVGSWLQDDGDHLATQLRYLAYLVAADGVAAPVASLEHYLRGHLLRWVDRFADEVVTRSGTHLYRELAGLTAVYAHELEQRFASGLFGRSAARDSQPFVARASRTDQRGPAVRESRRRRLESWSHQ